MTDIKTPGTSDIKTIAGGDPNKSEQLVTCDQATIGGDGSFQRPLHTIGAAVDGVNVREDGSPIVSPATILDFTGGGVHVDNAGSGNATINIGTTVEQDDGVVVARAAYLNCLGIGTKPIGLDVGDDGLGGVTIEVDLSNDSVTNAFGSPPLVLDITKWSLLLVNANNNETLAPFTLPNPGSVVLEITLIAATQSGPVSVAISDFVGGAHTFKSQAQGDCIKLAGIGGVWYLISQNGFAGV